MKDVSGKPKASKKYRSGVISKEDDRADVMIGSDDDEEGYQNLYKYSDPKAAQRDYDSFLSEAEMAQELDSGFKKGGSVNLSQCKVSTAQKNKSNANW